VARVCETDVCGLVLRTGGRRLPEAAASGACPIVVVKPIWGTPEDSLSVGPPAFERVPLTDGTIISRCSGNSATNAATCSLTSCAARTSFVCPHRLRSARKRTCWLRIGQRLSISGGVLCLDSRSTALVGLRIGTTNPCATTYMGPQMALQFGCRALVWRNSVARTSAGATPADRISARRASSNRLAGRSGFPPRSTQIPKHPAPIHNS
jgi:hypothetical protein